MRDTMSCFDDFDDYGDCYFDVRTRSDHACVQSFLEYDSHRFHLYRIFYDTCLMCQHSKQEEIEYAWKDHEDEIAGRWH